jgi:hypothetical protein
MTIKEIVSFYVNESTEIIDITFRTSTDGDDEIRTDQIHLDEVSKFGYDFKKKNLDNLFEDEDEDNYFDLFSDDEDELNGVDEEELISFLGEYYLLFPDRLPEATVY